ncbi:MAG: hypothetical protein ACRDZN_14740 [Acidimicrobiales bacterium]
MAEPFRELAGGHGPAAGVKRHEDVSSVLVGERAEDGLEFVELA